jgi:hypothetical protein
MDVISRLLRSALHDLKVARWTTFAEMRPNDLKAIDRRIDCIRNQADELHRLVLEAKRAVVIREAMAKCASDVRGQEHFYDHK